uniref:Uncharacterized protein n=1 Tax=Anopheles coluzzii TaxID=1518534 RepID=A0A8W7Q3M1_ANOCL
LSFQWYSKNLHVVHFSRQNRTVKSSRCQHKTFNMSEEKAESSSSQETCIYTVETNPSGNGHEIHAPKTGECVKSSYKACLVSAIKKMPPVSLWNSSSLSVWFVSFERIDMKM